MTLPCLRLAPDLPGIDAISEYLATRVKPSVAALMQQARADGRVLVQPRAGVGGLAEMTALLATLEADGRADLLPVTVDSHTRLEDFAMAAKVLAQDPTHLNGFPVVAHGHQVLRQLDDALAAPLQIRHGSPDGRRLMAESVAGGITSFEGGPIGYNIPYCASVPLEHSLQAWAEIDELAGILTDMGHTVERELFGSLTAVAVPPSIALSCTLLEAAMAAQKGVRAISIAIPQGGHIVQDTAALRLIPVLAEKYLPEDVQVFAVLHQFMGVFPSDRARADSLIFAGALTALHGGAQKVICKTWREAHGLPDAAANIEGLLLSRAALTGRFAHVPPNADAVAAEQEVIAQEVADLVEPVLGAPDLAKAVAAAFEAGHLDVPFPPNPAAQGKVYPVRDADGALRFGNTGDLSFSDLSRKRNDRATRTTAKRSMNERVRDAIFYFSQSGQ